MRILSATALAAAAIFTAASPLGAQTTQLSPYTPSLPREVITITATVPLSDLWRTSIVKNSRIDIQHQAETAHLSIELKGYQRKPVRQQRLLIEMYENKLPVASHEATTDAQGHVEMSLPIASLQTYKITLLDPSWPLQLHTAPYLSLR